MLKTLHTLLYAHTHTHIHMLIKAALESPGYIPQGRGSRVYVQF